MTEMGIGQKLELSEPRVMFSSPPPEKNWRAQSARPQKAA
jgi:hypothetical protein